MKQFENSLQSALESFQMKLNTEPIPKTSKPVYRAPVIDSEENGVCYLTNGNTITREKYDAMWHPVRAKVFPLKYKGENPDKTKVK